MIASSHSSDAAGERTARPRAKRLEAHLLDTAVRLFAQFGYSGTSVDQIAAAAGAGKQSIYRRFPTKEALFEAAVTTRLLEPEIAAWEAQVARLHRAAQSGRRPLYVLRDASREVLDFVRRPSAMQLYRIIVAEGARFPRWIALVVQGGEVWERTICDQLKLARDAGDIGDVDLEQTHRVLVGLLTGWVIRRGVGGSPPLDDAECDRFFASAWSIFERGLTSATAG